MNSSTIQTYFASQQPAMLDAIRQLVTHETPSHDKPRLDAFADLLGARFRQVGAAVEVIENEKAGNHLVARYRPQPATDHAQKTALILCHFDTVWQVGTLEKMPFRIERGCAYGPGIFDMKSSLVLAEFALRALRETGDQRPETGRHDNPESEIQNPKFFRPVTVLMTSDEEVGSRTSRELIEEEARKAEYVLVLESPLPGGMLKTARKGIGGYRLEVAGKAAHAGVDPDKGISAILEMAHQIQRLYGLIDREKGTTLNVGVVAGGTAANVIAANASAQIDVRAWTKEESDRISEAMEQLRPVIPGCRLTVTGGWNRPPLEKSATMALFERVRAIGEGLGLSLTEGGTGGGSDGNFTGALGIPTIDGLGVPGAGAHADHEHIEIDQITGRAALLASLLREL